MRRLEPLFTGLGYYSKTIEVLCNGTPYMPWIWAPIKLILKISSDHIEAFEKIIKAYDQIAQPLQRFKIIDRAFSSNKDVQQSLAIFYSDILKFHKEAYRFVRRSSWRLLFLTSWGRFQRRFEGIIEDLKAHEELVDKTANAVHASESKEMRRTLQIWRQEHLDKLAKEESEQTAAQYLAIVGCLKADESTQLNIFDAIASETSTNPGTCDWILKQSSIQAWMRCHQSSTFLLLHGRPGSGKSVLATQIVQFLQSSKQSLVVSHFCTYSYEDSMDYGKILRSVLMQLIRSDTDLIAYVHDVLVLKKKVPGSKLLEDLIRSSVSASSLIPSVTRSIHIIIDGLDECDQTTQSRVIKMMERVVSAAFSSGSTICKVLLSSRMSSAIAKKARQAQTVSLSDENDSLEKAIETSASQRLSLLQPQFSQLRISNHDLNALGLRIAKKAEGMFLWARLVLDYLASNMFLRREEILSAADALPQALQQFYEKILTQIISHFDERSIARMRSIFGWIAFAKRPLRKAEFRSALAFSSGDPTVDELAPQYLFDKCIPLVEERRDSTFSFIHVSVKEYLQNANSNMTIDETACVSSHGLAIAACLVSGLRVLTPTYPEQSRQSRVLRGIHGFHSYATKYWVDSILSNSEAPNSQVNSDFFHLCCELSAAFEPASSTTHDEDNEPPVFLDQRLAKIHHQDNALYVVAQIILSEEWQRYLQESSLEDDISTEMIEITSLKSLLNNYQRTVQKLLSLKACTGGSLQELESFRQNFRTSAFTCRLLSCPHSSHRFEDHHLRLAHEAIHRKIVCHVEGCQYPPFSSIRALKRHQGICHNDDVPDSGRMVIRKAKKSILRLPVTQEAEQSAQAIDTIDMMDLPPAVQHNLQPPPEVKKWSQLMTWLN
ncbi:NACHT domain-containing protein [Fusarium sp. LHS14.1]|nr:NACHT domain-containing protein [Fusarium sp. LHS14.1]